MKKILIALLALAMCFSLSACGKDASKPTGSTDATYFSLEELVNDSEFQQIFTDSEDEVFTYNVSASGDVFVYEAHAKKMYEGEDLEFFRNLSTEEISDKFGLGDLQKLLKGYGFGNVTIKCKVFNGDGALITERTIEPKLNSIFASPVCKRFFSRRLTFE